MSGDKRTVAFQVPGELFERFKDYLQEKGIKQNAFFLDCIHRALAEAQPLTLAQRTRAFEKQEILRLLACNGSHLEGKKKTAAQLGISLASLYNKLNGSF